MWKRFIGELNKSFGTIGSTLITVALVTIIIEEAKLFLSFKLLVIGIIVVVAASLYSSKEENND
ncbi:Cell division protein FtsK [uncultured Gammaproteobacteria bacterium]|nr:Cell division protein FtsK [uncultured Gammaproteobacteria bacterium]